MKIRALRMAVLACTMLTFVAACSNAGQNRAEGRQRERSPQRTDDDQDLDATLPFVLDSGAKDAGPLARDALAELGTDADPPLQAATDSGAGDAWVHDASVRSCPEQGLGTLSCTCNSIDDAAWSSAGSPQFASELDLGSTGYAEADLTEGSATLVSAGASAAEVAAFEVLTRCEQATLSKTAGAILYRDASGKKLNMVVTIDERKVGVMVTRAVNIPRSTPITEEQATSLLKRKLDDIALSAANTAEPEAWARSILSVIAAGKDNAETIRLMWQKLEPSQRGDVILFVTASAGEDSALY